MQSEGRSKPFHRDDRFEVIADCAVPALTHWRAPFTDGFTAQVPKGLVVVAVSDAQDDWRSYPGLPARPENYDVWERRLVSPSDLALRDAPRGYDGFTLCFDVADIGTRLRQLG